MSAVTTQAAQSQTQPQAASGVSTWLNRVFVVVVLVAIPLLYYFGYFDAIGLNRFGIILNFLAGFMLAPELLGLKRIIKVETTLERVIIVANDFLERPISFIKRAFRQLDAT